MAEKKTILTDEEVLNALDLDSSFLESATNRSLISSLSLTSTELLKQRTGKDWSEDEDINPIAKQCASDMVASLYYHDEDHDYTALINILLSDLKDIYREESGK